jgi:hypothetical protein
VLDPCFNGGNLLNPLNVSASRDQMDYGACLSKRRNMKNSLYMQSIPSKLVGFRFLPHPLMNPLIFSD